MPEPVTLTGPDDRGVARLVFQTGRPANVLHRGAVDALLEAVRGPAGAEDIRVLVISGTPGAFCGGADLRDFGDLTPEGFDAYVRAEMELFEAVEATGPITLAVLDGPCLGNGAELALACDLRVMTDTAAFGFPETRVGFGGPALRLPHYVGLGRAKRMLYEGTVIGAAEAEALGLVGWTCPADALEDRVEEITRQYAALPTAALALTKATLGELLAPSAAAHDREWQMATGSFRTRDSVEGRSAFLEHREADFRGH